jgi:uncharacterized protein DUF4331
MHTAVIERRRLVLLLGVALGALALALVATRGMGPDAAQAASHREAPLISLDGPADISDFFMFRSYQPGNSDKVSLIMNVNPGSEPSSGPNYWNFDPSVTYAFHVDNDRDGKADDVSFEFRFDNEIRGTVDDADLFLSYVGGAGPFPPITDLSSPGIGLRQKYEVTMVRGHHRTRLGRGLIAVPSNVGPRTMPDYEALAAQGIHDLGSGVKVFAGQRQDPFYIDLGGVFDTFNFRRPVPALTIPEDENDNLNPFGTDMLSGFNVSTIALELPSWMLTGDTGTTRLGAYASTGRPRASVRSRQVGHYGGKVVQVQRLANPLINETIIGTEDKDEWNSREPEQESRFRDYYVNPRLALALQLVFGVPAATTGREDLVDLLLKYQPSDERLSELLRLNLAVAPTPLAAQRRMGPLATPTADPAAWPNGRRPKDDVTDIAVRVVGGANYVANRIGDGVNTDDAALTASFPYLGTPSDGRNRHHDNP